jgi:hypothetical protein
MHIQKLAILRLCNKSRTLISTFVFQNFKILFQQEKTLLDLQGIGISVRPPHSASAEIFFCLKLVFGLENYFRKVNDLPLFSYIQKLAILLRFSKSYTLIETNLLSIY